MTFSRAKTPFFSGIFEKVKSLPVFKSRGRGVVIGDEGYHLREGAVPYMAFSRAEKDDIGPENSCFWDIIAE